jgi:hypothetical protein
MNPLAGIFDILLNANSSLPYLQLVFGLFAKMLLLSGSSLLQIEGERALYIQEQIRKGYGIGKVEEETEETVDLYHLFATTELNLKQKLKSSQLLSFLQMLLPYSQQTLTY